MLPLHLHPNPDTPLSLLCLGAHSDDIEIGCGGTLLTLLSRYRQTRVVWVVFSGGGRSRTGSLAKREAVSEASGRK